MAQIKTFTWTNASSPVARNLDVGFTTAEITIVDSTNGGSLYWNSNMADASVLVVEDGTITTTNGVTPLSQGVIEGAPITGFTNATPGVITASLIAQNGIVAGDTIGVAELSDDGTGTTLNGTWTVASVTATTITLNESTASTYSAFVSGGMAYRISDSNGDPVVRNNVAIRGLTLGTSAVGGNSGVMSAVVKGAENVT